jgi:hypothetical protein
VQIRQYIALQTCSRLPNLPPRAALHTNFGFEIQTFTQCHLHNACDVLSNTNTTHAMYCAPVLYTSSPHSLALNFNLNPKP